MSARQEKMKIDELAIEFVTVFAVDQVTAVIVTFL
jgi:hypothetical protein